MNTKICTKCGAELTLSLFGKSKVNKDGYRNDCKECRKQYYQDHKEKAKQYQQANKEAIAERRKHYYQDNKDHFAEHAKQYYQDNKDHFTENAKQYYQSNKKAKAEYGKHYKEANKEANKENAKQYYQNNREYFTEYAKQYKEDHKEYLKQYNEDHKDQATIRSQKRRTLKKLLPATLTINQWENIKTHFNNKCAYCGKELPLAQEHFIALSKGGEYSITNIIPSCQSCNSSKSNKNFFTWYPKHKYFSEKRELKILDYLKEKEG